ncbi:hypothetical protein Y1Q_0018777 [Alligator mississippiensis]|uniref:Uncharacterized protein n=1 Tax=Alligator mississippiensis TaxID=8496 RepID=A0A151NSE0_ALLMI|nr:hypothetical protein Y1Q_0018777 [Alligator mississippiensis]
MVCSSDSEYAKPKDYPGKSVFVQDFSLMVCLRFGSSLKNCCYLVKFPTAVAPTALIVSLCSTVCIPASSGAGNADLAVLDTQMGRHMESSRMRTMDDIIS